MKKAKKVLLSVVAMTLVAVLSVAGTLAYLQDSTEDVVNTFEANQVKVTLTEPEGEKYSIVPGTSEAKTPKVTVTNTIDCYVYIQVTDATSVDGKKLVTYEIADGWNPLEGYTNVYYRVVGKGDKLKEFPVIKDNTVSYPASITNEDMLDAEGKLRTDIKLTFKASAVQKEPFGTPENAWKQIPAEVATADEFTAAVAAGKPVTLTEDITLSGGLPKSADKETEIDLGENTITIENAGATSIGNGESLILKNGELVFEGLRASNTAIGTTGDAKVTLENVNITSSGACVFPQGPAEITITNSTLNSPNSYCISTNANSPANYNAKIHVKDSTLNANTAVLINVPCELTMDNCTVNGEMHGVIVRGGTAVLNNCTINNTAADDSLANYFDSRNWGSGNTMNLAGITIGNKVADSSTSYRYPSKVTLNNTTVTSTNYPTIYIWGNPTEENGVTLTYDAASSVGTVVYGGGYAVVNGTVQTKE